VIGIGRPAAGDDAAGVVIARTLGGRSLPPGVEVHAISSPEQLVGLLAGVWRAILIDALADADAPGTLRCLRPEQLAAGRTAPVSSHGLDVAGAIALARMLDPAVAHTRIEIVTVSIVPPTGPGMALSAAVEAAVPAAVRLVLALLEEGDS
jgi:hydrogenase maturation protease